MKKNSKYRPETTEDAIRWRHLLVDTYEGDGHKMLVCEGMVLGAIADFRALVARGVIYRRPDGRVMVINRELWGNRQRILMTGRPYQESRKYVGYTTPEEVRDLVHFILTWLPQLVELAHLELDAAQLLERLLGEVPATERPEVRRVAHPQQRRVSWQLRRRAEPVN